MNASLGAAPWRIPNATKCGPKLVAIEPEKQTRISAGDKDIDSGGGVLCAPPVGFVFFVVHERVAGRGGGLSLTR